MTEEERKTMETFVVDLYKNDLYEDYDYRNHIFTLPYTNISNSTYTGMFATLAEEIEENNKKSKFDLIIES